MFELKTVSEENTILKSIHLYFIYVPQISNIIAGVCKNA